MSSCTESESIIEVIYIKNSRFIRNYPIDWIGDEQYRFSMTLLSSAVTGEQFRFWLDDVIALSSEKPNEISFLADAGTDESTCQFILPLDGSDPYIDKTVTEQSSIDLFPYGAETIRFMKEFRELLIAQWYGKIESLDVCSIIKLVRRRGKTLKDAVYEVLGEIAFRLLKTDMRKRVEL